MRYLANTGTSLLRKPGNEPTSPGSFKVELLFFRPFLCYSRFLLLNDSGYNFSGSGAIYFWCKCLEQFKDRSPGANPNPKPRATIDHHSSRNQSITLYQLMLSHDENVFAPTASD